ncbi:MAG: DUF2283 domain-containing protein [Patescibacteria group bacterium]
MRFHYDDKKDALYIRFDESVYKESDEVEEGIVFDYNSKKKLVGIEILDASRRLTSSVCASLKRNELPISVRA